MAIAMTISPVAPTASLIPVTASFTGLATSTTYSVTVVGPNGTQVAGTIVTGGGTTGTATWNPDGAGTYTFYTTIVSAAIAVPAGAFTVEAIN